MKYYETTFDEYINAKKDYDIHPELNALMQQLPTNIYDVNNMIFYGPTGIGKYTQVLNVLKNYSPSELKYERKITTLTDKLNYLYKISDIHYEVDMALLGCNSKIVWHEIFLQIIDIISVKQDKIGFIVCKNFHMIHSELLDIFYSYMQHFTHMNTNIHVRFIIITEHISFLPNKIFNNCYTISMKRPSKEKYSLIACSKINNYDNLPLSNSNISERIYKGKFNNNNSNNKKKNIIGLIKNIDIQGITNIKELKSFDLLYSNNSQIQELPNDNFNIICNKIIEHIIIEKNINFIELRDCLYDILTYNLDVIECIWYILSYLITNQHLNKNNISDICYNTYKYLKFYNNNYRPIYHLESIFFYITMKVRGIDEL
jgi:hypothetical protein